MASYQQDRPSFCGGQ